ncbi:hypothetical protein T484DRAFT_1811283 [Baffinella frigidus]|nr:hypothetical protein T484DRAFT_1811283 [Cryptophyta sp. CCMP2293]
MSFIHTLSTGHLEANLQGGSSMVQRASQISEGNRKGGNKTTAQLAARVVELLDKPPGEDDDALLAALDPFPFFHGFEPETARRLARLGTHKRLARGDLVRHQLDEDDCLTILLSGTVSVRCMPQEEGTTKELRQRKEQWLSGARDLQDAHRFFGPEIAAHSYPECVNEFSLHPFAEQHPSLLRRSTALATSPFLFVLHISRAQHPSLLHRFTALATSPLLFVPHISRAQVRGAGQLSVALSRAPHLARDVGRFELGMCDSRVRDVERFGLLERLAAIEPIHRTEAQVDILLKMLKPLALFAHLEEADMTDLRLLARAITIRRVEHEPEVLWVEGVTTSDDKLAVHLLLAGEVLPDSHIQMLDLDDEVATSKVLGRCVRTSRVGRVFGGASTEAGGSEDESVIAGRGSAFAVIDKNAWRPVLSSIAAQRQFCMHPH